MFITVNCFDNSESIAVSMATNVTACDVRVTQWNDYPLMWHLQCKSTPVVKESIHVCITTAECGFVLA